MPGRTLRIAITRPKKIEDYTGLIIECKSPLHHGGCTVGIVERIARYGFEIDVLATDDPTLPSRCTVTFDSDYRNISREDLPIYIGLKNKSERFESILMGED